MAAPKRRGRLPPKNPAPAVEVTGDYERVREAKISENMKKMQQLGILHLAQTLSQSASAAASSRRRAPVKPPGPRPPPSRRSLRLKGVKPDENEPKEEIYTEEHDKLLGTCNTPWTFIGDGYETLQRCHQCTRRRTHYTSCCKCQNHHGTFCGKCLYMRYGENVLEVKKNPKWICPICRGICNCRPCRAKKGWLPTTGNVYQKAIALGYKSVAHFLIATHRAPPVNSEDSSSMASTDKECSTEKVAHISGQSMDEHTATTPEGHTPPLAKSGGKKRPRAVRGAAH